jgi:predicted DNA-binding ribbon-helix-helix protein
MQIVAPDRCSSRNNPITASPFLRIQVPRGLVSQQDQRIPAQRPSRGHALLLAASSDQYHLSTIAS